MPKYENGKFYYINVLTKKRAFTNAFEEAYPFIDKSALVKKDGHYGVINEKGLFLIEPKCKRVYYLDYERYIMLLDDALAFDMLTGKKYLRDFIICEELAYPDLRTFKNKNKYGIRNASEEVIIEAVYDTILHIDFNFVVAKRQDKIGVVD